MQMLLPGCVRGPVVSCRVPGLALCFKRPGRAGEPWEAPAGSATAHVCFANDFVTLFCQVSAVSGIWVFACSLLGACVLLFFRACLFVLKLSGSMMTQFLHSSIHLFLFPFKAISSYCFLMFSLHFFLHSHP